MKSVPPVHFFKNFCLPFPKCLANTSERYQLKYLSKRFLIKTYNSTNTFGPLML